MAVISKKEFVKNDGQHDQTYKISHVETGGRIFEVTLRRNRVKIECTNPAPVYRLPRSPKTTPGKIDEIKQKNEHARKLNDWRYSLSEKEKVQLFALILDEYRKHSMGDEQGYRGAALGVSGDQIFLGTNTTFQASPYFKDCAEQNMVNAACDMVIYDQVKKSGWDVNERPDPPKFDALYMMGGVSQDRIPISCPCGKCTDMLRHAMTEKGKIYALPILTDEMAEKLKNTYSTHDDYLQLNTEAKALSEIREKPRDESRYEVWSTSIDHLNAHREIVLDAHQAKVQRGVMNNMLLHAASEDGLLEEQAAHERKTFLSLLKTKVRSFAGWMGKLMIKPVDAIDGIPLVKKFKEPLKRLITYAQQASENEILKRNSIPELDSAMTQDENGYHVSMSALNTFMYDHICNALADRMRRSGIELKQHSAGFWKRWVEADESKISSIRCVVIQLDDGTFRYAMQANSVFDSSMPNAETAALQQALESLGRYGVRHVWQMEFNPQAIREGKMPTSPKEGIERIVKKNSRNGVDFTYIPLNSGTGKDKEIERISKTFGEKEIFPSLFRGHHPEERIAIDPPQVWKDYVASRSSDTLPVYTALS